MSKLLFIRPQNPEQFALHGPPLELLEIGGLLVKNGHIIKLLDLAVNTKYKLAEWLDGIDIVLVAYYSLNRRDANKIIKIIKKIKPNVMVVAGTVFNNDSFTTTMWQYVLENIPQVDVCTIGEAEMTTLDIANGLPLSGIPGIAYRNKEGKVVRNGDRIPENNLDMFGLPAWEAVDFKAYKINECGVYNGIDLSKNLTVPVRFSRGCPGSCRYCALWWVWRKWRTKSGGQMANEIFYLYDTFGARNFDFRDDCFGVNRPEVIEFCDKIIERGIKIAFTVSSRADVLNDETILKKLKSAGCYRVFYGFESGSQEVLDAFNKKIKVETMIETAKLVKQQGFALHALLIVGSSSETEKTINETIDFLNIIQPGSVSFVGGIMLIPGTAYYSEAVKNDYINDSFWLSRKNFRVDYSRVSKFKIFLFIRAVKRRKKIDNIKKEYNLVNYLHFSIIEFLLFTHLKKAADYLLSLMKNVVN